MEEMYIIGIILLLGISGILFSLVMIAKWADENRPKKEDK